MAIGEALAVGVAYAVGTVFFAMLVGVAAHLYRRHEEMRREVVLLTARFDKFKSLEAKIDELGSRLLDDPNNLRELLRPPGKGGEGNGP